MAVVLVYRSAQRMFTIMLFYQSVQTFGCQQSPEPEKYVTFLETSPHIFALKKNRVHHRWKTALKSLAAHTNQLSQVIEIHNHGRTRIIECQLKTFKWNTERFHIKLKPLLVGSSGTNGESFSGEIQINTSGKP